MLLQYAALQETLIAFLFLRIASIECADSHILSKSHADDTNSMAEHTTQYIDVCVDSTASTFSPAPVTWRTLYTRRQGGGQRAQSEAVGKKRCVKNVWPWQRSRWIQVTVNVIHAVLKTCHKVLYNEYSKLYNTHLLHISAWEREKKQPDNNWIINWKWSPIVSSTVHVLYRPLCRQMPDVSKEVIPEEKGMKGKCPAACRHLLNSGDGHKAWILRAESPGRMWFKKIRQVWGSRPI